MKKFLRGLLLICCVLALAVCLLPFLVVLPDDGISPEMLADDPDGTFVDLQGIRVYYEDSGAVDAPALILLHGLFGSTESWHYNRDVLVKAGYRVIALDRPGAGLSAKSPEYDYSPQNQAALLVALLEHLSLNRVTMIGHSAGAGVATHFALQYPQYLEQLVLVDAALLVDGAPAFVGALIRLPFVWRWGQILLPILLTPERLRDSINRFYHGETALSDKDLIRYWRTFQTRDWEVGFLALSRDIAGEQKLSEAQIRSIDVPVILLWGAEDTVTPPAHAKTLQQWFQRGQLIMLPDVGHQPFEENPALFNETLLAALSD